MKPVFLGHFSSKEDIEREFNVKLAKSVKILFAIYDQPPYEGWAYVLYKDGGKLYETSDSHCSCNGLEFWTPEIVTVPQLENILENGRFKYCEDAEAATESFKSVLKNLKKEAKAKAAKKKASKKKSATKKTIN